MYEEYVQSIKFRNSFFTINSIFLGDIIPGYITTNVSGRESLEMELNSIAIGHRDGEEYINKRELTRTITIYFNLVSDTMEMHKKKLNDLKLALYTSEAKFIFYDEPTVYFIGTVRNISIQNLDTSGMNAIVSAGTIEIYCSDPYKYSIVKKQVTNDGSDIINITNMGNKDSVAAIDIEFSSECGYAALVSGDRYYQIGNPDEIDGIETTSSSTQLFDDHMWQNNGWLLNSGVLPPTTQSKIQIGSVSYTKENSVGLGEGYVKPSDYGSNTSNNSFHGPSLTKIVQLTDGKYPVNWSSSFRIDCNMDGATNRNLGIGHTSISYIDENDEILLSFVLEDLTPSAQRIFLKVYVDDELVWTVNDGTDFDINQGPSTGIFTVDKIGEQLSLSLVVNGITLKKKFKTFRPTATLRKMTWYAAKLDANLEIRNNFLRAINCRMHTATNFEDIPNYFQLYDIITISDDNRVSLNGLENYNMVDIGSQPILLKPGQNTINILKSSFANIPNVTITFQERWL